MLGYFKGGRFVPDFDAMKSYGASDDDDNNDRPRRRRARQAPHTAARRSGVFADITGVGDTAATAPKAIAKAPTEKPPLLVRAIAALRNPAKIPPWVKISAVVAGGVVAVGTLAYFEERHYARLRRLDEKDKKDNEKDARNQQPKWRRVT